MNVKLIPIDSDRFFIRADGRHAGGITLHSACGDAVSYGIAIAPAMRRRGIAAAALTLLFPLLRERGYRQVQVDILPDNAASLALHHSLGFQETPSGNPQVCHMVRSLS